MGLPKNHFSLLQANTVTQICAPLFNTTAINHFTYSRIYNDGQFLALVSDANNHQHFWEMKYSRQHFPRCKEGITLLESRSSEALCDAHDYFNIDYNIVFTTKKEQYYESVVFATHRGNDRILNFYLNNIDVLKLFTAYFNEKASKLLQQAEKELIVCDVNVEMIKLIDQNPFDKNQLMNTIRPKKYEFSLGNKKVFLSRMEFSTLERVARGDTAKIAGKNLGISPKTVESYMETIKTKFNCNMKNELLEIFYSNYKF